MDSEDELDGDTGCIFCKGTIKETQEASQTVYGTDPIRYVEVVVPVMTCTQCDQSWTDWRAERISHDAVCMALGLFAPSALIRLRGHLGLDARQMCDLFGVPPKMLDDWETRRRWPDRIYSQYMQRVARSLGLENGDD